MEASTQEILTQALQEVGVENAGEVLKKTDLKKEDIVESIRVGQRTYLSNDEEFAKGFVSQGQQGILAQFYETASKELGFLKEEIVNKPIEEVLKNGLAKAKANSTLTQQQFNEQLTEVNRKLQHEVEVVRPQIIQQYEKEKLEDADRYYISEILGEYDLTHKKKAVLPAVMDSLKDKNRYLMKHDPQTGALVITLPNGNPVRNATGTKILDVREIIVKEVEELGYLKAQKTPGGGGAPTPPPSNPYNAPLGNPGAQGTTPAVSQKALLNAQRMQDRYKRP